MPLPSSRFSTFSVLTCFLLAACHGSSTGITVTGPRELSAGLHDFASCTDLLTYFQQQADYQMTVQLLAEAAWADNLCYAAAGGVAGSDVTTAPATAGAATTSAPAFSGTNDQVAGVDESDIVKTFSRDGNVYSLVLRNPVYSYNGGNTTCTPPTLEVVQTYPVASAGVVSSVPFGGALQGMLLDGNMVVVISQDFNNRLPNPSSGYAGGGVVVPYNASSICGLGWYGNAVRVSVVDLTNVAAPVVVRERLMQGSFNTARLVNDSVRVVTDVSLPGPQLQYWPSMGDLPYTGCGPMTGAQRAAWQAAFDKLIEANRTVIYKTTLADWLPQQYDRFAVNTGVRETNPAPADCTSVLRPGDPAGTDLTRVTTISLSSSTNVQNPWDDVAVVAEGDTVYASTDALYVATNPYDGAYWLQVEQAWQQAAAHDDLPITFPVERISVHRFSITDPVHATYTTSGTMDGVLIGQYALDEFNGALRVASTLHRYSWWDQTTSSNDVTIFAESNTAFQQVGQLVQLQPGEHVSAVRFLGDKGYINTTQNWTYADPLLTLDLHDPTHPSVRAILPVQSSATYLYPMDENHLIAVGMTSGGDYFLNNAALSIYDVTQLSAPVDLKEAPMGSGDYAYSQALYDPHAFTYFTTQSGGQPLNLLTLPVTIYGTSQACSVYGCYQSGLRVFAVDINAPQGFTVLGDVYHDGFASSYTWGNQGVQRSVIMGPTDTGHTYVISISNLGVKITDVATLAATPAGTQAASVQAIPF